MAEWTFAAVTLGGRECGHDHRTIDSAVRCLPKLGKGAFLMVRSPADREAGRPCLIAAMGRSARTIIPARTRRVANETKPAKTKLRFFHLPDYD